MLEQHLADALHDAAEDLAFEQHVVDDAAAVVDRDVVRRSRSRRSRGSISTSATCAPPGKESGAGDAVERVELAVVAPRDLLEGDGEVRAFDAVFAVA